MKQSADEMVKREARMRTSLLLLAVMLASGCGADGVADEPREVNRVASSGKQAVPLSKVPQEVLDAVRQRAPGIAVVSAEAEMRDGRRYFDVGGALPDGSEIELDILEQDGRWRVVETQRDLAFGAVPPKVRTAALAQQPALRPSRVIESRQEDGLVIYEVFSPAGGDPQGRKTEVRWDGREATVLTREWAH